MTIGIRAREDGHKEDNSLAENIRSRVIEDIFMGWSEFNKEWIKPENKQRRITTRNVLLKGINEVIKTKRVRP